MLAEPWVRLDPRPANWMLFANFARGAVPTGDLQFVHFPSSKPSTLRDLAVLLDTNF
jgi:hypothetical protein